MTSPHHRGSSEGWLHGGIKGAWGENVQGKIPKPVWSGLHSCLETWECIPRGKRCCWTLTANSSLCVLGAGAGRGQLYQEGVLTSPAIYSQISLLYWSGLCLHNVCVLRIHRAVRGIVVCLLKAVVPLLRTFKKYVLA